MGSGSSTHAVFAYVASVVGHVARSSDGDKASLVPQC